MSKSLVLHQKHAILHLHTNEIKHPTLFLPQIRLYLFTTPFFIILTHQILFKPKKIKIFPSKMIKIIFQDEMYKKI
jgi:hypothetical protein